MTAKLVALVGPQPGDEEPEAADDEPKEPTPLGDDEALAIVDGRYDVIELTPRYRGAYLGRSAVRGASAPSDLYDHDATAEALVELYPPELQQALEKMRALETEHAELVGLQRGLLRATARTIAFRGERLRRRDLPPAIERVHAELEQARRAVEDYDRRHRSAHLAAARAVGRGWPAYLESLAALLHYADHAEAERVGEIGAHLKLSVTSPRS
jgi:hypothetical protein